MQREKASRNARVRPGILAAMIALPGLAGTAAALPGRAAGQRLSTSARSAVRVRRRLADTLGHRKMATPGVIVFAGASAVCGLTPKSGIAEAWLVTFRAVQGAGAAIMLPAALGIVVQTSPLRRRGKAWPCSSASPAG